MRQANNNKAGALNKFHYVSHELIKIYYENNCLYFLGNTLDLRLHFINSFEKFSLNSQLYAKMNKLVFISSF